MKAILGTACFLVALVALTAAPPIDAQPSGPAVAENGRNTTVEAYRIGPEDILLISVWKNEPLSRTVTVRPDGKISLALLNDIQAAGLTALELRDIVTKRLAEYIPSPEVSVIVSEVHSFKVSVIGEVVRAGRFDLKSRTTVVDALALAGGFTQFASRSRIVILRPEGPAMTRIPFNYNKLVAGEQDTVYLKNGDIVLVP